MKRALWWLACWPEDHPVGMFIGGWLFVLGVIIVLLERTSA